MLCDYYLRRLLQGGRRRGNGTSQRHILQIMKLKDKKQKSKAPRQCTGAKSDFTLSATKNKLRHNDMAISFQTNEYINLELWAPDGAGPTLLCTLNKILLWKTYTDRGARWQKK